MEWNNVMDVKVSSRLIKCPPMLCLKQLKEANKRRRRKWKQKDDSIFTAKRANTLDSVTK